MPKSNGPRGDGLNRRQPVAELVALGQHPVVLHADDEAAAVLDEPAEDLDVVRFAVGHVHDPLRVDAERVHPVDVCYPAVLELALLGAGRRGVAFLLAPVDDMTADRQHAVRPAAAIATDRQGDVGDEVLMPSGSLAQPLAMSVRGAKRHRR